MKHFSIITCLLFAFAFTCCQSNEDYRHKLSEEPAPRENEKTAVFAEGCFWHSEMVFESLEGVNNVLSGYAGGNDTVPTYEKVSNGQTGHAEAVKVYYDPSKISYKTLVDAFFASHDPTSLNRQGQDLGTEYRSVAFYTTTQEKQTLDAALARLNSNKKFSNPIVTEIIPLKKFYPAEEFHQDYVQKHPDNDYVKYVCVPEFLDFKINFNAAYKPVNEQP